MYRGFNLLLNNDVGFLGSFLDLEGAALPFLSMQRRQIERTLNSFLCPDGSLNGSKMKANWFPQINADIFISHSHEDEQLAIALAGWLHEKFGLVSFIDSVCFAREGNALFQLWPVKEIKVTLSPANRCFIVPYLRMVKRWRQKNEKQRTPRYACALGAEVGGRCTFEKKGFW